MAVVATSCTFWRMAAGHHYYVSDGPRTRIGHIALAGQVLDAKPPPPQPQAVVGDPLVHT